MFLYMHKLPSNGSYGDGYVTADGTSCGDGDGTVHSQKSTSCNKPPASLQLSGQYQA